MQGGFALRLFDVVELVFELAAVDAVGMVVAGDLVEDQRNGCAPPFLLDVPAPLMGREQQGWFLLAVNIRDVKGPTRYLCRNK